MKEPDGSQDRWKIAAHHHPGDGSATQQVHDERHDEHAAKAPECPQGQHQRPPRRVARTFESVLNAGTGQGIPLDGEQAPVQEHPGFARVQVFVLVDHHACQEDKPDDCRNNQGQVAWSQPAVGPPDFRIGLQTQHAIPSQGPAKLRLKPQKFKDHMDI